MPTNICNFFAQNELVLFCPLFLSGIASLYFHTRVLSIFWGFIYAMESIKARDAIPVAWCPSVSILGCRVNCSGTTIASKNFTPPMSIISMYSCCFITSTHRSSSKVIQPMVFFVNFPHNAPWKAHTLHILPQCPFSDCPTGHQTCLECHTPLCNKGMKEISILYLLILFDVSVALECYIGCLNLIFWHFCVLSVQSLIIQ